MCDAFGQLIARERQGMRAHIAEQLRELRHELAEAH
jgi:hypothetical protein